MTAINELSFEQAYAALEDVIRKLESGELPLEDAVSLYEQGRQLSQRCQALLDSADLRIKRLHDDGTLSTHQP